MLATLTLHTVGLYQFITPAVASGIFFISRKWMLVAGLGALGVIVELVFVIASWTRAAPWIENRFVALSKRLAILGWWNVLIFAITTATLTYVIYGAGLGEYLPGVVTILSLFWTVSLTGCLLLKAWSYPKPDLFQLPWLSYLGISLLLVAFSYRIASFFPDISRYPFTLSWSETSRYYYASLFFGKSIYGISIPPTVLHPSRYLMQAIPFLLPGSPLWLHRTWQVILWIGVSILTSLVIVKRLSIQNRLWNWAACLWIFLFLLIGPVYYHLQVPVVIICLGFNRTDIRSPRVRNMISLIAVLTASAWAGISRINWFPVPGLLAAAYWMLEEPFQRSYPSRPASEREPNAGASLKAAVRYSIWPSAWFILGISSAFASQALYILWSGNPAREFTTSLSSGLLWYRMWPNPTYALGILPGILLVSIPLIWLAWLRLKQPLERMPFWHSFHFIRWLGLASILGVLFIAGLIVSVKIGGGSNLHNLDSYMVLLLVISTSIYFGKAIPDQPSITSDAPLCKAQNNRPLIQTSPQNWLGLSTALGIVVLFSILGRGPVSDLPDQKSIDKALKEIYRHVETARQTGGEILFISNRHLITFQDIKGVQLVPEYERVFLMEMAMAGNSEYLDRFHNELKEHRFTLIVSEPLFLLQKDENEIFGEENNAWVQNVSRYVLCYYREDKRSRAVSIQFFTPHLQAGECP